MAIRRSMNVEHYKAQQAKPLFLSEPPRYVTKRPLPLWAVVLCAIGCIAIGYGGMSLLMLVL